MKLLAGKKIADRLLGDLKRKIKDEKLKPGLAVILIGDDEASEIYVRLKEKAAKKAEINFNLHTYSSNVSENEVLKEITELNKNGNVHGIIVQLPLPKGLDKQKIIEAVDPKKDADGFLAQSACLPVFPQAILKLIKQALAKVQPSKNLRLNLRKKAIIISNSEKFGKVMRAALEREGISAEYILIDELQRTLIRPSATFSQGEKGIQEKMKSADIVITAVGKPGIITGEMLKKGAIVIDGGITKKGQKVLGDIDLDSVKNMNGFLSPVPGGVGPVTVACLLENVYLLTKKSH